jgi:LysR family transcriptional activator of nhaA
VDWLNYHHLFYFSVIAEEGGVAPAARKLRVTHSTLSTQLKTLEAHFGAALFDRRGKRLILTPFGREAVSYAADIFRIGRELNDVARGRASSSRQSLAIGVAAGIPKSLAHRLLSPALNLLQPGTALVKQDAAQNLVDALASGRLHVVITNDAPMGAPHLRLHAHLLGETDILFYAKSPLARQARAAFPTSLASVPMVLPPPGAPLRKRLDAWFAEHDLQVTVAAEVDDAGLLRAFGSAGRGVFPVRAALKAEVEDLRDVQLVGECQGVRERYYALTTERRIRHPAITALLESARAELHQPERPRRREARPGRAR